MTSEAEAAPVTHVGRYEMGAEIASGGMATVYLARASGPSGFEKLVALKRVHPHLAKEEAFVDMFLDEARIASRIQHPNVCQVFDFGDAGGEYFIAMEFLVGETLGKLQRAVARSDYLNNPRRPYVCCRLVADACEGLHAAHELKGSNGTLLNVVHRDVSPQNIFITYDGNAKVVDFGIASASDRLHQTSTGTVKGKFAYMAPEQARGQKVDRRADVFALGVVLWEVLAFKRLFRRETQAETLVALMGEPITPPSQISPFAPPELDAVVMKALARNPDDRYPTARDLGSDILRTLGRIGDFVDRAEVAEWMEALFPDGRRRHDTLLETARWGEERTELSNPGPVSSVVSRSSSWSGVRPEEALVDAADVVLVDDGPAQAPPSESTALIEGTPAGQPISQIVPPSNDRPIGRYIAFAVLGLLVAGLTGAVIVLALGGNGDRSGTAQVASPNPSSTDTTASAAPSEQAVAEVPTPEPDPQPAAEEPAADTNEAEASAAPETTEGDESASDASEAQPSGHHRSRRERLAAIRRAHRNQHEQAARRAPATGPGTVVVSTPGGWANVYDEHGRLLGDTPLSVQMSAGSHRLSLRPFGQPPSRSHSVEVRPGQTARWNQPL